MKRTLSDLERLQEQLNSKLANYTEAIKAGEPFDKVKTIYLQIKDLQKEIAILVGRTNNLFAENKKN